MAVRVYSEAARKRQSTISKAWAKAHPEEVRAASKRWRAKNPEVVVAHNNSEQAANYRVLHRAKALTATKAWKMARPEYTAAWLIAHPGYTAAAGRRHTTRLHEKLTGRKKPKVCEVCKRSSVPIHYDHCHKSGLFRGWLCRDCNAILGYAHDSTKILQRLVEYLDASKARPKPKGERAKAQKEYAAKKEKYARTQAKKARTAWHNKTR